MDIQSEVVKINKPIILKYEDREINLPQELKTKINDFWKEVIKENQHLYNGQDYCIESVVETKNKIEMTVVQTNYAHYLYEEKNGIEEEQYMCIKPYSGILLLTKDGYYAVGEMNTTTSVPNCLQIAGGGIDKDDIDNGIISIDKSIKRELKEELNLDLEDIDYNIEYLEIPCKGRRVYGFFAVGSMNMSKEELEKHFYRYKKYLTDNNLEVEFSNIIFLNKNDALNDLEKINKPQRPYFRNLMKKLMESNL